MILYKPKLKSQRDTSRDKPKFKPKLKQRITALTLAVTTALTILPINSLAASWSGKYNNPTLPCRVGFLVSSQFCVERLFRSQSNYGVFFGCNS